MDATRRAQYLEALGIDLWVPRHSTASAAEAAAPIPSKSAPILRTGRPVGPEVSEPEGGVVPAAAPLDTLERWQALKTEVSGCIKCGLHATRTQTVFGVGSEQARWLIIGEAPGAEEDRQGEPFVGRAGQLLNSMLRALELSRETVFIANILKCRPPGNRDPKPEEVRCCLPYLLRQIALIRPTIIVAVGRVAAQNLLATEMPLGRLRGKVHQFGELNTPLVVTYHPAYLLRSPADKRKAWEDLKFARSVYRREMS